MVTCPVLATDTMESIYRIEARRICESLTQLKDGKTKVHWSLVGKDQGALKAKVAAMSHLHAKVIEWLDSVFGVKRSQLEEQSGLDNLSMRPLSLNTEQYFFTIFNSAETFRGSIAVPEPKKASESTCGSGTNCRC